MHTARTWIEINHAHLDHNIHQYKKVIGKRKLLVVIKANAYGHGITQLASLCQNNQKVHALGVATSAEALLIRSVGITKLIFILSLLEQDITPLLNKNIHLPIYDLEGALALQAVGAQYNCIIPVHIKIDTGLSRLGILPEDALTTIQTIQKMPPLSLQGVYSHFAESHQVSSFTHEQANLFQKTVVPLAQKGIPFPFVHCANSAATTTLDLPFCNLFRVGIGAFGLWPSAETQKITRKKYPWFALKPILSWKTRIRAIKTVSAGNTIGYDRAYRARKEIRIAILPIGYADGYDFRLFNKSSVIVREKAAPIIGRISMNMCTIDVSHLPDVQINDEVLLMGPQKLIHPAYLGQLAGNPNVREMTTKINPTITRLILPRPNRERAINPPLSLNTELSYSS